jgi:uncharacterized protein involved in exopolysaccharide biosynthesis
MSNEEHNSLPVRSAPAAPARASGLTGMELDTYRIYQNLNSQEEFSPGGGGGGGFSLRNICYSLFRHKFLIFISCAFSVLAVCVYLTLNEATYRSSAQILMRGDKPNLEWNPTGEGGGLVQPYQQFGDRIRQERAIITGTRIPEMVVEKMGPVAILSRNVPAQPADPSPLANAAAPAEAPAEPGLIDRTVRAVQSAVIGVANQYYMFMARNSPQLSLEQKAARFVQRNIEVNETMGGSFVLELAFTSFSPESAQRVLQCFLESYLDHHIEIYKNRVDPEILERKAEETTMKLIEKENELDRLGQELNIASLSDQQAQALQTKAQLESNLTDIQHQISALEKRIESLTDSLENPPESEEAIIADAAVDSPELAAARAQLSQLELELIALRTIHTESSDPVKNLKKQIADVTKLIAAYEQGRESAPAASPVTNTIQQGIYTDLQGRKADLAAETARRDAIKADVEMTNKELARLNTHASKFKRLARDIASLEAELQLFETGIRASKTGDLLDEEKITNLDVLQPPTLPLISAASPRKMLAICAFILFMGLAAGVGLAFGLDFLNHSLRTNDEVEQWLGLPVLVSLPKTREHRPQLREETP